MYVCTHICKFGACFSAKHTKTGKNIPKDHKMCQTTSKYNIWPQNRQIGLKIPNTFYCKTFLNLPKVGFLVCKSGNADRHLVAASLAASVAAGHCRTGLAAEVETGVHLASEAAEALLARSNVTCGLFFPTQYQPCMCICAN
jgi:hypothetical protein